jgi:hypothetical protein
MTGGKKREEEAGKLLLTPDCQAYNCMIKGFISAQYFLKNKNSWKYSH